MTDDVNALVEAMTRGSEAALSRLMTLAENNSLDIDSVMQALSAKQGQAYCIGITGAPGVGKSTLVNALTAQARDSNLSVGIVAADPSSVRHGGALLGDRIRMQSHFSDNQVFIRSMGTRGNLGGLPRHAAEVVKLLAAFGKDLILVETVGVGQTEVAIADLAHTVVLVVSPESGDSIQFMKAGILEIADIVVVNKSDHPHADRLILDLNSVLSMGSLGRGNVAIYATQASKSEGISELFQELEKRRINR